jgi:heme exporter protein D
MFIMTIATTIFGRARMRNNMSYNGIGTIMSGTLWFWSFRKLLEMGFGYTTYMTYIVAVTTASLLGQWISLKIEKKYNILADPHKHKE